MLVKRHFEAMVFAYLAEELRTGDIAVDGGAEYGDWSSHLLIFDQCRPLLATYCAGLKVSLAGAEDKLARSTGAHPQAQRSTSAFQPHEQHQEATTDRNDGGVRYGPAHGYSSH